VEGDLLLDIDGETMRARRRIMYNGMATVSLVVYGDGALVVEPRLTLGGLVTDAEHALEARLLVVVHGALDALPAAERRDDEALGEAVRRAIRRAVAERFGKRPVTTVHVMRL